MAAGAFLTTGELLLLLLVSKAIRCILCTSTMACINCCNEICYQEGRKKVGRRESDEENGEKGTISLGGELEERGHEGLDIDGY